MLTTEEEAKQKWCCLAMSGDRGLMRKCAGSECMAWRWAFEGAYDDKPAQAYNPETKEHIDLGFCGMAGMPLNLPRPDQEVVVHKGDDWALDDGSMKA